MSDVLMRATWHNAQQGSQHCKAVFLPWCGEQLKSGRSLVVEARLYEDAKTDRQRAYYHGVVLTTIAKQAKSNNQQYPMPVWKEYFRNEYLGYKTVTTINPMTGKKSRRRIRVSTEDLGVRAYSDLIDRVTAFAATELGVTFDSFEQWEQMQVDPDTGEILG